MPIKTLMRVVAGVAMIALSMPFIWLGFLAASVAHNFMVGVACYAKFGYWVYCGEWTDPADKEASDAENNADA